MSRGYCVLQCLGVVDSQKYAGQWCPSFMQGLCVPRNLSIVDRVPPSVAIKSIQPPGNFRAALPDLVEVVDRKDSWERIKWSINSIVARKDGIYPQRDSRSQGQSNQEDGRHDRCEMYRGNGQSSPFSLG